MCGFERIAASPICLPIAAFLRVPRRRFNGHPFSPLPFSSEDMHDIDDKEDRIRVLKYFQALTDTQDEFWVVHKFIRARMDRAAKLTAEQDWVGELWEMPEEPQPQPEADEDEMKLA